MMKNKTNEVLLSALLSLCAALLTTHAWAADKPSPAEAQKIAKDA